MDLAESFPFRSPSATTGDNDLVQERGTSSLTDDKVLGTSGLDDGTLGNLELEETEAKFFLGPLDEAASRSFEVEIT